MIEIVQNLLKLQALDFEEVTDKNAETTAAELRAKIPPQILGHYDRLVARGKKGVAMVRNQVCTGCHMRQPIGVIMTLKHDADLQLCESCGRYLFLSSEGEAEPLEAATPAKPKKGRRPKKSSLAA